MVLGVQYGKRWVWCTAAAGLLWAAPWPGRAGLVDFSDKFLAYVATKWGREAPPRMAVWQRLVRDNKAAETAPARLEATGLRQVNGFFNQVPFYSDLKHWGSEDYWATPTEMLGSFGGDCEDYSIAKYLSLKEVGVPVEKLRITYVRALKLGESHMVLAYYPTPDADPLILDNLNGSILPASQRPDLEPVYGFNDDDLWVQGGASRKGGASNVRLWRDLLEKLAREKSM
jgi:predicted transglutaminase-like cysteine proteinase